MTSSPQPCPTCAAPHVICCVAENMQHQTHSRSPLTHEDMLERDRSGVGFISICFPAANPPRARQRGARSPDSFSTLLPRTRTCSYEILTRFGPERSRENERIAQAIFRKQHRPASARLRRRATPFARVSASLPSYALGLTPSA